MFIPKLNEEQLDKAKRLCEQDVLDFYEILEKERLFRLKDELFIKWFFYDAKNDLTLSYRNWKKIIYKSGCRDPEFLKLEIGPREILALHNDGVL